MSDEAKIVIEGDSLLNLIDEFVKWENISDDWYAHIGEPMWENWKKSPKKSDARRQAIVYGNCLGMMEAILGRREVKRLMDAAREAKKSEQSP